MYIADKKWSRCFNSSLQEFECTYLSSTNGSMKDWIGGKNSSDTSRESVTSGIQTERHSLKLEQNSATNKSCESSGLFHDRQLPITAPYVEARDVPDFPYFT